MLRYEVTHPVVNDRNMLLWRALGVSSWPTLMVVSPKGHVIATLAGEKIPPHSTTPKPLLIAGAVAHVKVQLFAGQQIASHGQHYCFERSRALVQMQDSHLRHAVRHRSAAMWSHVAS